MSRAGEEKEILVEHDDGIRADISTAALAKLKPVFKKDGSTTAGNSSQVRLTFPGQTLLSGKWFLSEYGNDAEFLRQAASLTFGGCLV